MQSPFEQLGGRAAVEALAYRFYERMDADEPELAAVHRLDANGRVAQRSRDAFARFLVFWLGGPDDYLRQDGHPRLRMRHAPVKINAAMRDAWVRCMQSAMNDCSVSGEIRSFLDARFAEVAEFLVNHPSEQDGAGLGISLRGPVRTPSAPK